MGRTILLLVNPDKPEDWAAADAIRPLIQRHGTLAGEQEAGRGDGPLESDVDMAVVVGGDGTLLSQARRCVGVPLLGVNVGRLGFLAEFDVKAVQEQAAGLFGSDELSVREVSLLRAEAFRKGERRACFSDIALNEAVVTAGPPYRMIELGLSIDGEPGPKVSGDGLIVSTPTGSTAYNVSAGGPIVAPGSGALVITPIAAHSLAFRPIVVPGESRIEITVLRANQEDGGGTTLMLDGQACERLYGGERIVLGRDERPAVFVRNPRVGYWETLIQKMGWAAPPRTRGQTHGRDKQD
jgi:NAD+ kinase